MLCFLTALAALGLALGALLTALFAGYKHVKPSVKFVYTADGGRLLIDAEWRGGSADPETTRGRILNVLGQRGLRAELAWVDHVPRTAGKTRRVRPLADRERVMASASLLRKA